MNENIFFADPPPPSQRQTRMPGRVHALVILILLLLVPASSSATPQTHRTVVHFRQNKSQIDPGDFRNARSLDSLLLFANLLKNDTSLTVTKIRFEAFASPEGPGRINKRLAKSRLEALRNHLKSILPFSDSITERSASTCLPDIADAYARASRHERLEMLETFDSLRYAAVEIFYSKANPSIPLEQLQPPRQTHPETNLSPSDIPDDIIAMIEGELTDPARLCRPFYMSLRTNMLYDALLIPSAWSFTSARI